MSRVLVQIGCLILCALFTPSIGWSAGVLDKKNFVCYDAQGNEYGVSSRLMNASGMLDAWYGQVFTSEQLSIWEETQSFYAEGMEVKMGYLTYNGSYTKNIELRDVDTKAVILAFEECDEVGELSSLWNSWSKMLHEYNGYF